MKNKILFLLTLIAFFYPTNSHAQSMLSRLRSPFMPWLPVKEEPIPEPPQRMQKDDHEEKTPIPPRMPVTNWDQKPLEKMSAKILTPQLTISGLIWNSDRPQAIINGKVVEENDALFGVPSDSGEIIPTVKINRISQEGVEVSFNQQNILISPQPELLNAK